MKPLDNFDGIKLSVRLELSGNGYWLLESMELEQEELMKNLRHVSSNACRKMEGGFTVKEAVLGR